MEPFSDRHCQDILMRMISLTIHTDQKKMETFAFAIVKCNRLVSTDLYYGERNLEKNGGPLDSLQYTEIRNNGVFTSARNLKILRVRACFVWVCFNDYGSCSRKWHDLT